MALPKVKMFPFEKGTWVVIACNRIGARAPSEWPFFAYSNIPYSFSFIFEYRIYSNMGNSLQNEPYWSKIHWDLAKLRQNMPVQSQYAFMISILLSRIGARTGNIKTKLLMRHHMRGEGMATYSFRFLTSYSNIRILLRSKKYSNFEFYSYSLGALVWGSNPDGFTKFFLHFRTIFIK